MSIRAAYTDKEPDDAYALDEFEVPPSYAAKRKSGKLLWATVAIGLLGSLLYVGTKSKAITLHRTRFQDTRILSSNQSLLHTSGCSSRELLDALHTARIRSDGWSTRQEEIFDTYSLEDFQFSFDLARCSDLHIYTATEACGLLTRFGGLNLQGDSYVRHFAHALYIWLRSDLYGAALDRNETCKGEKMFDDGQFCRYTSFADSQKAPEPICGGNLWAIQVQNGLFPGPFDYEFKNIQAWRASMPDAKQVLSWIQVHSHGLHLKVDPEFTLATVKPIMLLAQHSWPKPLPFWFDLHAPGANKPVAWIPLQGPDRIRDFNAAMRKGLEAKDSGLDEPPVIVDYYAMTDGARSYDGTHYSLQVNLEKVQIFLNVLDLVVHEIGHRTFALGR